MAQQKGRNSYFAEIRQTQANPNYFNNIDLDKIKSNVRRILKDIANGNIIDEDYIYFRNNNVISVCIEESLEQAAINFTTANALRYYKNNIITNNLQPFYINVSQELMVVSAEENKCVRRENLWKCANIAFTQVRNGADPKSTLMQICIFREDINRII